MKKMMKKFLKSFIALFVVFMGAMCTAYYFVSPATYSSILLGAAGLLMLYPAYTAYMKWFDNLFAE